MKHEAVAVGRKDEGHVECVGIAEGFLHSVGHGVRVVFGLNNRRWDVWFEKQHTVRALALAPTYQFAAHDDAAIGEAPFLADLRKLIPARFMKCRGDEPGADVPLTEGGRHRRARND